MSDQKTNESMICYDLTVSINNGVWQAEAPITESFPLFVSQLTVIIFITRLLFLVLKPLHQPRLIAEVLVRTICYIYQFHAN